eukprot:TRINITY_DN87223_c0_g1_i1.p1 TRINITY_DN87223_c0_g1~~TRINITY_DN87223_c0_g1_i1.p1  ORF type:complete len:233 (+),score=33.69 TRINITY_DN87223_c0_g1_i1:51-749(+)
MAAMLRKQGQPRRLRKGPGREESKGRMSVVIGVDKNAQSLPKASRRTIRSRSTSCEPPALAPGKGELPVDALNDDVSISESGLKIEQGSQDENEQPISELEGVNEHGLNSMHREQGHVQEGQTCELGRLQGGQTCREAGTTMEIAQDGSDDKHEGGSGSAGAADSWVLQHAHEDADASQQHVALKIETCHARRPLCSQEEPASPKSPGCNVVPSTRVPWCRGNLRQMVRVRC